MAETVCDVVHCPTVGNKHWMFDPRLADVVNIFDKFAPFDDLTALGILSYQHRLYVLGR